MNKYQIIIEGIDGSGKTTLAKDLINIFHIHGIELSYMHFTSEDPKNYQFYSETMRKENYVYDRHFVGEMVYGPIFRSGSELSYDLYRKLVLQAELQHVIVIYCDVGNINNTFEILESRGEILSKKEKEDLFKSKLRFNELFNKILHYNYNFLEDSVFDLVNKIIKDNERIY